MTIKPTLYALLLLLLPGCSTQTPASLPSDASYSSYLESKAQGRILSERNENGYVYWTEERLTPVRAKSFWGYDYLAEKTVHYDFKAYIVNMKEQEELLANAEELCSSGKPKELLRARELCEKALTKDPYSEKGMMILKDVYEKLYKTGQLKTERQKEEDLKNQMLHNDLTPDSLKRFPYY